MASSSPKVVQVHCAQDGGAVVVPVVIEITKPIPNGEFNGEFSDDDSDKIVEALQHSLPGSTFDRVVAKLLSAYVSELVIPRWRPKP